MAEINIIISFKKNFITRKKSRKILKKKIKNFFKTEKKILRFFLKKPNK